ncbi:MAG: radical SAM protein [Candidatus Methanomethylophilus sp.]|nr:radical SAM protein [Methanomethylophilus sp.]
MRLGGFVKTTLAEWEGHDCCRLDVRGCNLRCPFCRAPQLISPEGPETDPAEAIAYIKSRGDTLDGIAVSGGEPLASPDLYKFLRELKKCRRPVMLETNGTFPDALDDLVGAELVSYVALSIFAPLDRESYRKATGSGADPALVRRSIGILRDYKVPCDFRVTAVPGLIDGTAAEQIAKEVRDTGTLIVRQFDPRTCLDPAWQKAVPYDRAAAAALSAAAKKYARRVKVRGF